MRKYLRHLGYVKYPLPVVARVIRGYCRALLLRRPTLRSVEIATTYACQARCEKCYAATQSQPGRPELTVAEIGSIVAQAIALGAIHVNLTGGEALLRPDLDEVIAVCQPRRLILTVTTNALAATRDRVFRLRELGVSALSISLDSADAATHDRLRGVAGTYAQVLALAGWAREAKLTCCFSTVLAPTPDSDVSAIRYLLAMAESQDAWLLIGDAAAVGGWAGRTDRTFSWAERNVLLRDLLAHPRARHHSMYSYFLKPGCPAAREKIYVTAYGDITPCNYSGESFGSIRNESLQQIIARMRLDRRFSGGDCPRYSPPGSAERP